MPDERIVIKSLPDGMKPGDVIMVDGHPYTFTGGRGFVNKTLSESVTAFDSCADALTQTGGTLAEPEPYPVRDFCDAIYLDVEPDTIFINPFDDYPAGTKIFLNGRGYIKTGNKGTVTHILSAQPLSAEYDATCTSVFSKPTCEEVVLHLPHELHRDPQFGLPVAYDASPSQHDLILTHYVEIVTEGTRPGHESAYYFNHKTDSYLSIGYSTDFSFSGEFTIENWVKFDDADTHNVIGAHRQGSQDWPGFIRWGYDGRPGNRQWVFNATSAPYPSWPDDDVVSDVWYHIAIVRDSDNMISIYKNGTLVQTPYADGRDFYMHSNSNSQDNDIVIGRDRTATGQGFKGYIADLRIIKGKAVYSGNFKYMTPLEPCNPPQ